MAAIRFALTTLMLLSSCGERSSSQVQAVANRKLPLLTPEELEHHAVERLHQILKADGSMPAASAKVITYGPDGRSKQLHSTWRLERSGSLSRIPPADSRCEGCGQIAVEEVLVEGRPMVEVRGTPFGGRALDTEISITEVSRLDDGGISFASESHVTVF